MSIPLSTRLPLLVSAKIILLRDVIIRTILYAVFVVGRPDHLTQTERACAHEESAACHPSLRSSHGPGSFAPAPRLRLCLLLRGLRWLPPTARRTYARQIRGRVHR